MANYAIQGDAMHHLFLKNEIKKTRIFSYVS